MKIVSMSIVLLMSAYLTEAAKEIQTDRKLKRGVDFFGPPGFDQFGLLPAYDSPWVPGSPLGPWVGPIPSDLELRRVQTQATHDVTLQLLRDSIPGTPSIAYTPDIIRAIQQAKAANENVLLAQQRVAEVKQATIIQQKIALAKEAAARVAAERSEAISAHTQAEARASAQQLVVLQQKLATSKDAVAAAQRLAAAREAAAAAAIQRNASETAAQLRKQDVDKQISQTEREAKIRDLAAAKQHAIAKAVHHAAITKPVPHQYSVHHPWA
ncbi:uncharacterized protein LOC107043100 [Diachasma alloeum]|uniref:uncharacterized protein LOC107043100 n=1 Tax=Diachasma alloeum TaxID=454923 RepID=UPI00073822DA|nr:uncharacterized protein LOC107043100 [Diachasma alloeum]